MKKQRTAILFLSALFVLSSCSNPAGAPSQDGRTSSGEAVSEPDPYLLEEYCDTYLMNVFLGGMTAYSWDDTTDIRPSNFVNFYIASIGGDLSAETVPAEELESFVQQYFDVSAEHLRGAEDYDPQANAYNLHGMGGGGLPGVVGFTEMDGLLTLDYVYYSASDGETVIRTGILDIEFRDDASYRYVSCETVGLA